jgi:diaminopimelate decarboxylase
VPYNSTYFPATKLEQIAQQFNTPVYIYNQRRVRENVRRLKSLFPSLPVEWLYAVKANDNPHILKTISEEGVGFDVVSLEEALLASHFASGRKVLYTENNMSDEEMESAEELDITLNIGSINRLKTLCERGNISSCSIRVKPDVGDGHHSKVITGQKDSKFGIRMDHVAEAVKMAKELGVSVVGIHAHIGSGIQKPENLKEAMEILLNVAKDVPELEFVNFGGGIPIPYREKETVFDVFEFEELATPVMIRFLENHPDITFLFEPGRYIVGDAGLLLTEVTDVKDQGDTTYIGTNTGFNHLLRPILYEAFHQPVNISKLEAEVNESYQVVGNICESGDILVKKIDLPCTEIGDLMAFCDAGAYGMTMASQYNRRRLPAEVLITDDGELKLIRKRKSPEEMIKILFEESGFSK